MKLEEARDIQIGTRIINQETGKINTIVYVEKTRFNSDEINFAIKNMPEAHERFMQNISGYVKFDDGYTTNFIHLIECFEILSDMNMKEKEQERQELKLKKEKMQRALGLLGEVIQKTEDQRKKESLEEIFRNISNEYPKEYIIQLLVLHIKNHSS